MSKALRPRRAVERMKAYSPPTEGRAGKLRLDFNENTVGCSSHVAAFLRQQLNADRLSIYPEYAATRTELAAHFGVSEAELLLTNGTDEAVQLLINTFVDAGEDVIILQPSYAMYRFYAELAGATIREIFYRAETLAFPLEELLETIDEGTRAVLISNPNNPTGTGIGLDVIEKIAARAPAAAILLDEAYYEFFGVTALPLTRRFPNLFVSRTFSKAYGMAGMRLGCLLSDARNLSFVHKAQSPYSVNILAAMAVRAALSDPKYISQYVREVLDAREVLYAGLDRLGIPFYRSDANFVLMRLGDRGEEVREKLGAAGVLVRDRSHEIKGCVRVTVGTREQTNRFLAGLERIWRGGEDATEAEP